MNRSSADDWILQDRSACLRIISALKAGRAPREGIRYLGVGLDGIIQKIQQNFKQAIQGKGQIIWAIGDYGEGKSHFLRLMAAFAEEHGFAWAYLVHDKDQEIGLHKPARLFQQILWSLRWEHPALSLMGFEKEMAYVPLNDRLWRERLPKKLAELTTWLKMQGWQGLVVCLDEVENCSQFHWTQHSPAWETLSHLHQDLRGSVVLYFALTRVGLEHLKESWRWHVGKEAVALLSRAEGRSLSMPSWSPRYAFPLAERIWKIHAMALDWQPTVAVKELASIASQQAEAAQSGRWRTFVQAVVTFLEKEHQKRWPSARTAKPQGLPKPPQPIAPAPKSSTPHPLPRFLLPDLQPGDQVEIVRTAFRGWRGIVKQVKEETAEIVLGVRNQMLVSLPLDALKKLR